MTVLERLDLDGTEAGELCAGYGGIGLALLRLLGVSAAWHVEFADDPARILRHRFPGVPNHHDVKTTDWSKVKRVRVVSAGYPCQPFSNAGLRLGDKDPRHLWPGVLRAIVELQPALVVLENVRNHLNLGWARVLHDLDRAGYDVRYTLVRAADVGCTHSRARLYAAAVRRAEGGFPTPAHAPLWEWHEGGWNLAGGSLFGDVPVPLNGDGHPVPPPAGRVVEGVLWEEKPLLGNAPHGVFPTPRATRGGSTTETSYLLGGQRSDEDRPQGTVVFDAPDDDGLLPTPTVATALGGQTSRSGARKDELLLTGIARAHAEGQLLPTPLTEDAKASGGAASRDGHQSMLHHVARELGEAQPEERLLPTPEASDGTGGRVTAERGGSRPSGAKRAVTLATALAHDVPAARDEEPPRLLPTPEAKLSGSGPDYARAERDHAGGGGGDDLTTAVHRTLLPTPTSRDWKGTGPHDTEKPGGPSLSAIPALLPTPLARDGQGASAPAGRVRPDGRERTDADGSLTDAVIPALLPTPTAMDSLGSRNSTAWRSPDAGPHNSGDTLTDIAWKSAGHHDPRMPAVGLDGTVTVTVESDDGTLTATGTFTMAPTAADEDDHEPCTPEVGEEFAAARARGRAVATLADVAEGALFGADGLPAVGAVDEDALLPTPNPFHLDNSETVEGWLERRAEVQERTGTRHGPALPVVVLSASEGHPLHQTGAGPELWTPPDGSGGLQWGPYAAAIARAERIVGRPAPSPTEPGPKGGPRLSPRFVEWMMMLPDGWVTDPGVWEGAVDAKGRPYSASAIRNAQLHALGNGVVPLQAEVAVAHLLDA